MFVSIFAFALPRVGTAKSSLLTLRGRPGLHGCVRSEPAFTAAQQGNDRDHQRKSQKEKMQFRLRGERVA